MASSEQLKALVRSHIDEDNERFLSIALQVAAHEARKGHSRIAQEIRELVDRAKKAKSKKADNSPVHITKGVQDASGLLSTSYPKNKLNELITSDEIKAQLQRLIKEQKHMVKLKSHGLSPRRKVLLVGPPGTGKTYTASILAGELDFPLFQVRLDGVITKYLGESAAKLRQIFDAINEVRGVYFFDEFDALGSQRSNTNDVGEARRILNSFLQMIEQDESNSVIVCATNHVEILDHALFRRFDDVVRYQLPNDDEMVTLLKNKLTTYVEGRFPWKQLAGSATGLSCAELSLAAEDAIKDMLIHDHAKVTSSILTTAIEARRRMSQSLFGSALS